MEEPEGALFGRLICALPRFFVPEDLYSQISPREMQRSQHGCVPEHCNKVNQHLTMTQMRDSSMKCEDEKKECNKIPLLYVLGNFHMHERFVAVFSGDKGQPQDRDFRKTMA
jgi:hypothetical protein